MNILTDRLPAFVCVDGKEYVIRTDFRDCLRVVMAFEDNSLTKVEKAEVLLEVLYPILPDNQQAALEMGIKFLDGGNEDEGEGAPAHRVFSFAKDANLIFAAFRQTHGIDLETVEMHWWKFLALFMDLGSETTFCRLVSLRSRVKSGKATAEERRAASEMGEMFDVPDIDDLTLEERDARAEFLRQMGE